MNLQLSIGITNNPRTWPILDGTVKPEGIDLIPTILHPSELFWRQLHFAEFAVSEMSCSSFMIVTGQGDARFVGLPIFTTRRFFHTTIMVSRKSGIEIALDGRGLPDGERQAMAGGFGKILGDLLGRHGRSAGAIDMNVRRAGKARGTDESKHRNGASARCLHPCPLSTGAIIA